MKRKRQRRRRRPNKYLGKWFYPTKTISHIRFIDGESVPSFSMVFKKKKPCKSNKSPAGAVVSIADMGAAVSIMPLGHAQKIGATIDRSKLISLKAANGKVIKTVGTCKLFVKISPCPTYTEVEFCVTTQGGGYFGRQH